MKKDDRRDASIDTFLRSKAGRSQASSGSVGPCVDAETIAGWTEGSLSSPEAASVETHVAGCASCQQVLAVFARSAPDPVVSPSLWERWHLRWAVPLAAAAAAAAIWVAIPEEGRRLDDAFSAQQNTATDQNLPPAAPEPVITPQVQEKSEAPGLEARSDAASPRSAVREREEDASAKAAPASPPADAPQENRALADAQARSEVARRAPEAAAPAQMRQAGFAPVEIISPDPAIRWRILSAGQLERTTNAGQTWEPVPFPGKVTAVRALSATVAIATADGREFRTDDQGKTWNPVQP